MDRPLVVRAELPTPDAVIVRHSTGKTTIVVDADCPEARVAALINEVSTSDLDEGTGRALS